MRLSTADPNVTIARLLALGAAVPSLPELRRQVVALVRGAIPCDAALLHELSPRAPLERGCFVGLDPAALRSSQKRWDDNAVTLGRLHQVALGQGGVVTDAEAFPAGSAAHKAWVARVARPLDVGAGLFAHLVLRERLVSALGLFRRGGRRFTRAEAALLRLLVPALTVVDGLGQALTSGPPRGMATRLACVDQRLTPAQREIVAHVALGHTNAQIAAAVRASPHTIRNHLAEVFRRLGAANRADVVRLAVLR
jgi:DNA-binding CsgD family transcriptional regulator